MSAEARTRRIFLWAGGIVVLIMLAVIVAPMLFRRGEGYIYGMESYVYGYSMVVMDVTRDVLTAASAPNEDGTAAPSTSSPRCRTTSAPTSRTWCASA